MKCDKPSRTHNGSVPFLAKSHDLKKMRFGNVNIPKMKNEVELNRNKGRRMV